ncbi:MAG: T9SS type A sorting domain-containing protein [Chitinophagaceae bacterium]
MKKLLASVFCVVITCCVSAQLTTGSVASSNAPGGRIYFYQYKPPHYNNTDLFPLIVSLHGVGQAGDNPGELPNVLGDGLPKKISQEGLQLEFTWQNKTEGFIMLAPQTTRSDVNSWSPFYVDEMIAYGIANLRVDPSRVFLTGFSAGGGGVWKYATSSPAAAAKLAGIVPVASSSAGIGSYCNIASQQVAVWTFHGGDDQSIPAHIDRANVAAVNSCSPLVVPAVDTIYTNESHGIYMSVAYNATNFSHYPNVFQWMLKVNRNLNPAGNQNPVPVIAGPAVVNLTAPLNIRNFPVLDGSGSTDNEDIIMDYLWEQTGGPKNLLPAPVGNADYTNDKRRQFPVVTLPVPPSGYGVPVGTYTFRLRVKDYLTAKAGHTQFATKTVIVSLPQSGNAGPVADAGDDIILTGNETSHARSGGYENTYGDGGIPGYNWTFVSGPQTATLRTFNGSAPYTGNDNNVMFANMNTPGTYIFQFSVTNSFGTGTDQVAVTKLSALPVSYAYINGKNAGSRNTISWATTTEVNSDRFEIQRSTDGINFTVISTLRSTGGATQTAYSFDDSNAPLGVSYYRLSQVDKDGQASLSKVVSINNKKAGIFIEKYPNPVHDNLTVTIQGTENGPLQVTIADMQGKTILQQQWQKDQSLLRKTVNVAALQNGVYQMIITSGKEKQISSFVKY